MGALSMAVALATGLVTLPDVNDMFTVAAAGGSDSYVVLLLDDSNSMGNNSHGAFANECTYFHSPAAAAFKHEDDGNLTSKLDPLALLKAALVGCETATDGIIDELAPVAKLSLIGFPGSCCQDPSVGGVVRASFSQNVTTLESAVVAGFTGTVDGTPTTSAIVVAADHITAKIKELDAAGQITECTSFAIILMTDGEETGMPTNSAKYISQSETPIPTHVGARVCSDSDGLDFSEVCKWYDGKDTIFVDNLNNGDPVHCAESESENECCAFEGRSVLNFLSSNDFACETPGKQNITTQVIGFGTNQDENLNQLLQDNGGTGQPAEAVATTVGASGFSQISDLAAAFENSINAVAARAKVSFGAPSISGANLFSANTAYLPLFKPTSEDYWFGNIKSYCITPPPSTEAGKTYTLSTNCLFRSTNGNDLVVNASPVDIWTPSAPANADQNAEIGGAGQKMLAGLSVANPYTRHIVTYDTSGYREFVYKPLSKIVAGQRYGIEAEFLGMSITDAKAAINHVHGYTLDAASDGKPVAIDGWPMGEASNSGTVILRYANGCDSAGECYVVSGSNRGPMEIFDAFTGNEKSALIPRDITMRDDVSKYVVQELSTLRDGAQGHPYFVDGKIVLFHADTDLDLLIDADEDAFLIFALGRGGSALYSIDVSDMADGIIDAATPIHAITPRQPLFEDMWEQWQAPFVGRIKVRSEAEGDPDNIHSVAIFGSGHVPDFDAVAASYPADFPSRDVHDLAVQSKTCEQAIQEQVDPEGACNFWANPYPEEGFDAPVVVRYKFQVPGAWRMMLKFDVNRPGGPLGLRPGDWLKIMDENLETYGVYQAGVVPVPGQEADSHPDLNFWVPGDTILVDFNFSGDNDDPTASGWAVETVAYSTNTTVGSDDPTPAIYVVDLNTWNSPSNRFTDASSALAVIKRCPDGVPCDGRQYMTCPFSSRPSVVQPNQFVERIYIADECGQLFGIVWDEVDFSVRRILTPYRDFDGANVPQAGSIASKLGLYSEPPTSLGTSTNIRKVFTRVQPTLTSCPTNPGIAVYYGTGNAQRPLAKDELTAAPAVIGDDPGGDVFIGVFDDGSVKNLSLKDLDDITNSNGVGVNPSSHGWFFRFDAHERMLRDPIIFDGDLFIKTFKAEQAGGDCAVGSGSTITYGLNHCSGAAIEGDETNDRVLSTVTADIGSEFILITPATGAEIISALDAAELAPVRHETIGTPRVLNWRRHRQP